MISHFTRHVLLPVVVVIACNGIGVPKMAGAQPTPKVATPEILTPEVRVAFAAMGDMPYSEAEYGTLEKQLADLPEDVAFAIHLGDIKKGIRPCSESVYKRVAAVLAKSKPPLFIIPGDNEVNDCLLPGLAFNLWKKHFMRFDRRWTHSLEVHRQWRREENFSFVNNRVLFVSVHVVGGRVHNKDEWRKRHAACLEWLAQNIERFDDDVDSLVLFGHAKPIEKQADFFTGLEKQALAFKKPMLYLHGDGHVWEKDRPWKAKNLLRVQVDSGGKAPPVKITVTSDPDEPFQFDRRKD